MSIIQYLFLLVAFYLFGSIPFGLIYSSMLGVDIRKVGSGNIGATNVSRQFGFFKGFVPVFIFDFLKGALPVIIVGKLGVNFMDKDLALIIAGFASALGHIFPIYLGFKGGKGVATFTGIYFLIAPMECTLCLIGFLIVLLSYRLFTYLKNREGREVENPFKVFFKKLQEGVWASSLTAAVLFPVTIFILEPQRRFLLALSILTMLIVIFSHRKNIKNAY